MRRPCLCLCWVLGWGLCKSTSMCAVVKSRFKHTREEYESRGPMSFRCLIFNLSGPCELLFLLCFIASWT